MANAELPKIEQLCCSSISAAITKLCNVGTWPRPPRARALRVGYDFYRNELQDIQEVNNLIEYLACDDEIKSIYFEPSYGAEQHILYEYWEQLLLKILRETKGVLPTNHIFQKWFRRFLKELYSNTAVWRSIDTIAGLTLNGVELKFDTATILISRPAYRWLDIIRREQQYDLGVKWTGIGLDKATIITTVSILKHKYAGFTSPPPHLTQHIDRHLAAVEAIRLTGSGAPRINCHVQFQRSVFPISEPLAYCDREGGPRLYEKETVLKRGDFRNVRNLWRELMDTKYRDLLPTRGKSSAIDTALARFSMSYRLQNWLDSIVDLTIALESLFYPKDTQELSHRISLRAAWLLGVSERKNDDSSQARSETYNRIRAMYRIRNCRVHGGKPKEEDIAKWVQTLTGATYDESKRGELLEIALESARSIVRKAIKACMNLHKLDTEGPHWPLPDNFDENIVTAGQQKVWQKAAGLRK